MLEEKRGSSGGTGIDVIGFNNSEPSQMENTQTIRSRSPFDNNLVQNEGISIIIQNTSAKEEQKQKK